MEESMIRNDFWGTSNSFKKIIKMFLFFKERITEGPFVLNKPDTQMNLKWR